MTTILMSTFGSYGNTAPFMRLGEELYTRGHDVHLWTNWPASDGLSRPNIHLHAVGKFDGFVRFVDDAHLLNRFQTLPEAFRRHYLPVVRDEFLEMDRLVQGGQTIVIANDAPGITGRLLAEKHRIPLVSVYTYPNQLSSAHLIGTLLGNTLREEVGIIRSNLGLVHDFDPRTWWNQPNHNLALWPAWFRRENASPMSKTSFSGFLYYDPEPVITHACAKFLEAGPCILITGGSGKFAAPEFTELAVHASQAVGLRIIAVFSGIVPGGGAILHAESVPSLHSLMKRVTAIVHHGGMGTIGQATSAGIPQIVLADGGDRPENGRIVQHLGLGRFVPREEWCSETLGKILLETIHSTSIRVQCAAGARRVAEDRNLASICEMLERMADRAQLVESCVFPRAQSACLGMNTSHRADVTQVLATLSPERRYLLARSLKSRRP
jgi:rhamnosyltransferase subunit B